MAFLSKDAEHRRNERKTGAAPLPGPGLSQLEERVLAYIGQKKCQGLQTGARTSIVEPTTHTVENAAIQEVEVTNPATEEDRHISDQAEPTESCSRTKKRKTEGRASFLEEKISPIRERQVRMQETLDEILQAQRLSLEEQKKTNNILEQMLMLAQNRAMLAGEVSVEPSQIKIVD